jgi:hypothetical protein
MPPPELAEDLSGARATPAVVAECVPPPAASVASAAARAARAAMTSRKVLTKLRAHRESCAARVALNAALSAAAARRAASCGTGGRRPRAAVLASPSPLRVVCAAPAAPAVAPAAVAPLLAAVLASPSPLRVVCAAPAAPAVAPAAVAPLLAARRAVALLRGAPAKRDLAGAMEGLFATGPTWEATAEAMLSPALVRAGLGVALLLRAAEGAVAQGVAALAGGGENGGGECGARFLALPFSVPLAGARSLLTAAMLYLHPAEGVGGGACPPALRRAAGAWLGALLQLAASAGAWVAPEPAGARRPPLLAALLAEGAVPGLAPATSAAMSGGLVAALGARDAAAPYLLEAFFLARAEGGFFSSTFCAFREREKARALAALRAPFLELRARLAALQAEAATPIGREDAGLAQLVEGVTCQVGALQAQAAVLGGARGAARWEASMGVGAAAPAAGWSVAAAAGGWRRAAPPPSGGAPSPPPRAPSLAAAPHSSAHARAVYRNGPLLHALLLDPSLELPAPALPADLRFCGGDEGEGEGGGGAPAAAAAAALPSTADVLKQRAAFWRAAMDAAGPAEAPGLLRAGLDSLRVSLLACVFLCARVRQRVQLFLPPPPSPPPASIRALTQSCIPRRERRASCGGI